jgi:uncharacterized protein (TIGR02001 family)
MERFFNIFIVTTLVTATVFAQQKSNVKSDGKKIYGEANVVSNYVENGVSQSNKSWAIQSGFGYKMGTQARVGLWGSSVNYPGGSESVNLRPYFDVIIEFTPNSSAILKYELNRYFSSSNRDGAIFSLDLNIFNYHVLAHTNDNWEGTGNSSSRFGFQKEFPLAWSLILSAAAGYNQISAEGYNNYFDTRLGLGYKMGDGIFELVNTYNSSASQFNGRGDLAFFILLGVRF